MEGKDILDEKEEESLDNKYIIIKKEGSGATSKVFLVKNKDKKSDLMFAAKVIKNLSPQKIKQMKITPFEICSNEIKILNELKKFNCPYIANIIESGEGEVKRFKKPITKNKYIILDYAEKGCLFDYIYYPGSGLKEEYSRLIFYKIFQAIKICHDAKICNRDIKLDNILFDENLNPKLCDFGFGKICEGQEEITGKVGTLKYMAPEILSTSFKKSGYDGFKVDIFNLGIALFIMVTGNTSFCALKVDNKAKLLYQNKYPQFWAKFKEIENEISEEFKTLFINMVRYKPEERPDINKVLDDKWFKKIPTDKKEMEKLEDDMKKELLKRESMIKDSKRIEKTFMNNESSLLDETGNRSGGDESQNTFSNNLIPEYIDIKSIENNYIKIKGNLNPVKIMNDFYFLIKKEFGDDCDSIPCENDLKFTLIFEDELAEKIMNNSEEDENKEDNLDEDNDILRNDLVIQFKMLQNYDGDYLIRFVKKSGDLYDYYKKLDKIIDLVKSL